MIIINKIKRYYHRIKRQLSDLRLEVKWAWQRAFRGWDDTAIWGMGEYLSEIIVDVLKFHRDKGRVLIFYKSEFGNSDKDIEYNEKKLNEMIEGFKIIRDKDDLIRTDKEKEKVKKALNMLANKFEHFWE